MKRRTVDRGTDPPSHGIHAPDRIGKKRSMTPEGYMLCEGVPIARTGWMVYGEGETGVKTADNGVAMVHRGPEALFHPVTISSFNGKAVTDDHPPGGDVHSGNWKEHARGHVMNVRRGEGEDEDVLLGDMLITDKDTIRAVEKGKVEVSAGYDANYETTGPGEGKQHNIIGNHVALVDKGRCGPRCAIGDSKFSTQPRRKSQMPKAAQRRTVSDAVRKLFTDASEAAVGLLEPAPDAEGYQDGDDDDDSKGGTHVHVHMHGAGGAEVGKGPVGAGQTGGADDAQMAGEAAAEGEEVVQTDEEGNPIGKPATSEDPTEARFVAIESTMAKILAKLGGDDEPTGDSMEGVGEVIVETTGKTGETVLDEGNPFAAKAEPAAVKTGDSAALATSFQTLIADCEVLVPGFKTPTFDAKLTRAKTVDSMCATRRKALAAFSATNDGAASIATIANGKTVDIAGMPCAGAALLFNAAVGVRKAVNNGRTTDGAGRLPVVGDGSTKKNHALSIAEINALNATKYPRN